MTTILQNAIVARGKEIFSHMEQAGSKDSIFNKDWWYGRIMDWSMKDPDFKVQMFRFVDVLPYLNSSDEVARHLKEYFSGDGRDMPSVLSWGLGLGTFAPGLMAAAIRKNVTQMARMFITGSNPEEAFSNLEKMRKNDIAFTVDILGEAAVSETEAWHYQKRYLELLEALAKRARDWDEISQIDRDREGPVPKVNISVKASSLYSQLDPMDSEGSIEAVAEKLRPILQRARELNAFINLDMEAYFYKDLTLQLFKTILMEPGFRDYPHFGIVIQAYLRDSEKDLLDLIEWIKNAKEGG
jgi:RHH-type proline utilization regulon transcriptional repressor/proline dehydrogenase/delta 1-pyrroline-5-carboxylate dehydrogenase